jgi:hypothetical protein
MIKLCQNKKPPITTHFHIEPRDFMHSRILLPLETIKALNQAASILQDMSSGHYAIVVVRGYINWSLGRKVRGVLAKILFCALHWHDRASANLLFHSNGHEDGLSVDILPYDVRVKKTLRFLSWKNIMIGRNEAENILMINHPVITMIDKSMSAAGFMGHPDPREKLQMHYRLTRIRNGQQTV